MAPFLCLMFAIIQRRHKTKSPLAGVGFCMKAGAGSGNRTRIISLEG